MTYTVLLRQYVKLRESESSNHQASIKLPHFSWKCTPASWKSILVMKRKGEEKVYKVKATHWKTKAEWRIHVTAGLPVIHRWRRRWRASSLSGPRRILLMDATVCSAAGGLIHSPDRRLYKSIRFVRQWRFSVVVSHTHTQTLIKQQETAACGSCLWWFSAAQCCHPQVSSRHCRNTPIHDNWTTNSSIFYINATIFIALYVIIWYTLL